VRKVWIEAALNDASSRALQPGIPDTEGVACARAGAAVIHIRAYGDSGQYASPHKPSGAMSLGAPSGTPFVRT
jgi:uncharacterized protein (DUF849 family)